MFFARNFDEKYFENFQLKMWKIFIYPKKIEIKNKFSLGLILKMRVIFRKQLTYFWLMIRKINCFIFNKYLIWKLALVCQHLLFFAQKIKNSRFRTVDFSEFTNNYYKLDNKLSKRCLNKYIKYFIYQQFLISLILIDMYFLFVIDNWLSSLY